MYHAQIQIISLLNSLLYVISYQVKDIHIGWEDPDQDQWSKINGILVHPGQGFLGSFDAAWSDWCWFIDPDLDHPQGMPP